MSTPTPRTDEQINGKPCTRFAIMAGDSLRDASVPSEFARQLERELAAKDAQIVALREALESSMEEWRTLVNSGDAGNWNPDEDAHIILGAKALSTPPPPVVPLADVKPLIEALGPFATSFEDSLDEIGGGTYISPSFPARVFKNAIASLATFTAKHPVP